MAEPTKGLYKKAIRLLNAGIFSFCDTDAEMDAKLKLLDEQEQLEADQSCDNESSCDDESSDDDCSQIDEPCDELYDEPCEDASSCQIEPSCKPTYEPLRRYTELSIRR
jgi:hypothetical protein